MQISAAMVKELRERTGAAMMECKKALVETGGDLEAAVELMRKSGQAKADKKAGRVAADGFVAIETSERRDAAAMVEVNSETDFVAKGDDFREFAQTVAQAAVQHRPSDLQTLLELTLPDSAGATVESRRRELIAKLGENIQVRRFSVLESEAGALGVYSHGGRIGVLVVLEGADEAVAKDIAMHVAASQPLCVSDADMPAEVLEKEREIYVAQAAESGKPPEIQAKMAEGRLRKFLKENTLLGQPFVKDPDVTVQKYLAARGARVDSFERMAVGEGIEKKAENFAEEVMAQVGGN